MKGKAEGGRDLCSLSKERRGSSWVRFPFFSRLAWKAPKEARLRCDSDRCRQPALGLLRYSADD